ncbi:RNA dependent RNA polymerase-domain-containing protein [Sparassis latifolia]
MLSSDSENEFWENDTSQDRIQWFIAAAEAEAASSAHPTSSRGGTIGASNSSVKKKPRVQTSRTEEFGRSNPSSTVNSRTESKRSSSKQPDRQAGYDTDMADVEEVENMVETDTEASLFSDTSFKFSQFDSRTTSMTSVLSTPSSSTRSPRKRTLEYMDTFGRPSPPGTPSPKARKMTVQLAARASTMQTEGPQIFRRPTKAGDQLSPGQPSPMKKSISAMDSSTPRALEGRKFLRRSDSDSSAARAIANSPLTPTQSTGRKSPSKASTSGSSSTLSKSPEFASAPPKSGFVIVAHSRAIQKILDDKRIAWGVQYELARGVSQGLWSWDDVTESKLEILQGPNRTAAPLVAQVMSSGNFVTRETEADAQLWQELDREEKAIIENRSRGLGLQGEWDEKTNWYGGKLQQVASLVKTGDGRAAIYILKLEKIRMRKSTRFARFLGSRRVLQVNIPSSLKYADLPFIRKFMCQQFIVCGRIYVPFCSKEGKVYMMEINQDYERTRNTDGDQYRISLSAFLRWHNDLALNTEQPTTKWTTRFELGLSTSVPAIQFQGNGDIIYLDDKVAPYDKALKKAPPENIFTDGCGFMNGAALMQIGRQMGYSERPTALQGRVAGAKGVWLLHPDDQAPDNEPKIWIRPSQLKIKHPKLSPELSPAQLIFDLVAPPRVVVPSRLNRYAIMNLAHNGVPTKVFVELMEDGIMEIMTSLTNWTGPESMRLLWAAVCKAGRVTGMQLQRLGSVSSRALGLSGRFERDLDGQGVDLEDADDDSDNLFESTTGRDPYSGRPISIHEKVMELLQSGFSPLELPLLFTELRRVITFKIDEFLKEYHIAVPKSAEAFIVPDPYGILDEGEIHFRSSQDLKHGNEDLHPKIILGDVLIYRNPARVPSDIQKVTAVACSKLSEYLDVIVLPTKGTRSLASVLAGGDVDGDTCVCIFDPALVQHFTNPPLTTHAADFISENFKPEGTIETVGHLHSRLEGLPPVERQLELQKTLLSGLADKPVGIYSKFHEIAAYTLGYDHPDTIRNAFMFTTVLDSGKTGHKVKDDVLKLDKQRFDRGPPVCMKLGNNQDSDSGVIRVVRKDLPPFILDQLLDAGKQIHDNCMKDYDMLGEQHNIAGSRRKVDNDLLKPLRNAESLAEEMRGRGDDVFSKELKLIKDHVKTHVALWQSACHQLRPKSTFSPAKSRFPKKKTRELHEVMKSFAEGPRALPFFSRGGNLDWIKASCAYAEQSNFAFTVAFQDLCDIKAKAVGCAPVTQTFLNAMTMPSSFVKVLTQNSCA